MTQSKLRALMRSNLEVYRMEVGAIKAALDQIVFENTELKRQNKELIEKFGAIAKAFNGSFVPAHAELLTKNRAKVGRPKAKSKSVGTGRAKRLDEETRKLIATTYREEKKPVKDIAKQFGVKPFTVYGLLKREGIALHQT